MNQFVVPYHCLLLQPNEGSLTDFGEMTNLTHDPGQYITLCTKCFDCFLLSILQAIVNKKKVLNLEHIVREIKYGSLSSMSQQFLNQDDLCSYINAHVVKRPYPRHYSQRNLANPNPKPKPNTCQIPIT